MIINWIDILLIAFLVFNFGLLWRLNNNLWKLNSKFERHIAWNKAKGKR